MLAEEFPVLASDNKNYGEFQARGYKKAPFERGCERALQDYFPPLVTTTMASRRIRSFSI